MKAKTVVEFYEQKAGRWVNRPGTSEGEYCLGQALCSVYGYNSEPYRKLEAALMLRGFRGFPEVPSAVFEYNDAPDRTFAEVIALCKEFGV